MTYENLSNLFPLQKTLRFSLLPIGRTLETINRNGIINEDQHRAESFKRMKKLIDEYLKAYIEQTLTGFRLAYDSENRQNSLTEYLACYSENSRTEEQKKRLSKIQDNLRKQIANRLTQTETHKRFISETEKFIHEELKNFAGAKDMQDLIAEFKNFTTYFSNFITNRENMYSDKPQATAIAYRLIHENLPKFIDNLSAFQKFKETEGASSRLSELQSAFKDELKGRSIDQVFHLDFFNNTLTQTQIDFYNALLGGKTRKGGSPIQGLNQYVNLYNQQQKEKSARLPRFKPLFKQILSDRNSFSYLPEAFTSDKDVLEAIEACYAELDSKVFNRKPEEGISLGQLLRNLSAYDTSKIYLPEDSLSDISSSIFGHWAVIQDTLFETFKENNPKKERESESKYEERISKKLKEHETFSIAEIEKSLSDHGFNEGLIVNFFSQAKRKNVQETDRTFFEHIKECHERASELLNTPYPEAKNLAQDKTNVEKLKRLLDAIKDLQRFVKPLSGKIETADKDGKFYGEATPLFEALDKITPLYDKVRNHMTRKPYSREKIKLNFQNATLFSGWDVNKEKDNTAVILRDNGLYYLGVMDKKHNKIFDPDNLPSTGACYEKMMYKLLPNPYMNLPRIAFPKKNIPLSQPEPKIIEIKKNETFKKGKRFNLDDCHALIDFYKSVIERYNDWRVFQFQFSPTDSYNDISDFYKEVEQQGYKLSFCKVSKEYVAKLVEEGKLYLFQIYSKDFSSHSKGKPNLHTLYWKMLFEERNLADVVFKLNGSAEMFYRKASLRYEKPTHPAHQAIKNKKPGAAKAESIFPYDLIKDKRYTEDHFEFHVPITLNFKSKDEKNINSLANEYIRNAEDLHILGIDRGERHLLYISLINSHGDIVLQRSLNKINGTDYHQLLNAREKENQESRKSWNTLEKIKSLKEGYLSLAIREIADIMIQHNAIVVLEDLNLSFKRGRQKVEKQVYQKFEHMLIEKLNYLIDKGKDISEAGGALKALQLTNPLESLQKLGKQSGFLFYVPAWNTSKIDPATGFANLFHLRYESIEAAKAFFNRFDEIRYNQQKDLFEFSFDYSNFTTKAEGSREKWTLCSHGDRIATFRKPQSNNWISREINLTEAFKKLFQSYGIDWETEDLKQAIARQSESKFFQNNQAFLSEEDEANSGQPGLWQLFKLTVQMRNSKANSETDYIISPVADPNGNFYDSRNKTGVSPLPENADANGAYNIARKGLWLVEQIRKDTTGKPNLSISNKEWLHFAQTKPYQS